MLTLKLKNDEIAGQSKKVTGTTLQTNKQHPTVNFSTFMKFVAVITLIAGLRQTRIYLRGTSEEFRTINLL